MLLSRRILLVLIAVLTVVGCAPQPPPRPPAPPLEVAVAAPAAPLEIAQLPEPDPSTLVPVTSSEPAWGHPFAPVTWVIWGDYECPFTAKLVHRLFPFMDHYGPDKLRIVWRHNPLPFHKDARPLSLAAETALRLGGPKAFWRLTFELFEHQRGLGPTDVVRFASEAGLDPAAFVKAVGAGTYAAKIDEDLEQGKKVGVTGTPASLINGVFVSGAQPSEKFVAVIEEQLTAAAALVASGVPRERLYAAAVERNFRKKPEPPPREPEDTTTVWKVPLGKSPVRGKDTASVTIVVFADFQCPFCVKSVATLEALELAYGDKLRLVFKHNPLPFHPRAEPAAQLAIEAREKGGDAKFWEAHKLLYANQKDLSDQAFEVISRALGLDPNKVAKAVAQHKHKAVIDADVDLAEEIPALGTPHFFINGRRLVGAQPESRFRAIIDEEILTADRLVASGTPAKKIYEIRQKDGREPAPPERILVPAATAANPAKGAKAGPKVVVVQMFADLQCPFCSRAEGTMDELIAAFPGKVRVVWRHRPLAMHKNAQIASEAAVEAFKQKGEAGFWAFTRLLWADQAALDKEGLVKKASAAGLDAQKMQAALDAGTHKAAVQADVDLADKLQITGTPAFAVGDYFVSGAQSLHKFTRLVRLSLAPHPAPTPDSLHGAKPVPLPRPE